MRRQFQSSWKNISAVMALCVTLMTLVVMIGVSTPAAMAQAQPTPTLTPTYSDADPVWRGFRVARDAVEEERSVDLTYVRAWSYETEEYTRGLDYGCIEGIPLVNVRPIYWGWTYRMTDVRGGQHMVRISFDLRAVAVCDTYTDGAVPAPAATPNPNLPAPVTGPGATGTFALGGHVDGLSSTAVTRMRQSGMTWVKKQLRFSVGDGLENAQAFINDARNNNFSILLGIVGLPNQMGNFDTYITQYADFVGRVAALGPNAIEVWNEPNLDREWPTGQISGANYTRLLAAAYNAIKRANPNVLVISGAPAPTGAEAAFPGQVVNDDNFMRQMQQAGAAQYMDCLGLHYNEGIVSPTRSTGDPRDNYPTRYYGTMLSRGTSIFPNTQVCWTELGYLSGEGMGAAIPAAFAWANGVTVAQHATWLGEAVTLARQSGRVRLFIVWNVNFTIWDSDPMGGYAIMRPNGTCPACETMGRAMGVSQ